MDIWAKDVMSVGKLCERSGKASVFLPHRKNPFTVLHTSSNK